MNHIFSVKKYVSGSKATAFKHSLTNAFHISANLLLECKPWVIMPLLIGEVNVIIFTKFGELKYYICENKFWLKLGCRYV